MSERPAYPLIEVRSRTAFLEICRLRGDQPFIALSPAGAGTALGIAWWLELVGDGAALSILDCGASRASARLAVQAGIGWATCRFHDENDPHILSPFSPDQVYPPGSPPFSEHARATITTLDAPPRWRHIAESGRLTP